VTFLFSDIEGSTRLLDRLGAAKYRDVVGQHRTVLRAAFTGHRGDEIGTEGDSFFVAFDRAVDALSAALAAQTALIAEGIEAAGVRVRMGLHTGDALRTGSEYYGLSVHQAARIAGAAYGGQVLVSGTTAARLVDDLPAGAALLDLGEHRLRDLERPQRLLQLCHPDLATEFPPPRSLELVRHNLPVQNSSFVGRDLELRDVGTLLAEARLVSLLGPGGTGKTRLAYQAAARSVENFPGGIWVVELAPVTDPASVPSALLRALALREEPAREVTELAASFLRDREALVIVDNCEHVIEAAAALAHALLGSCPSLRVLATSREALRVPGEVTFQVPGLSLPPASGPDYLTALADVDAVRLFVSRASDVRRGFMVNDHNAADIAAICTRLDGLPLAIELAASWARTFSPTELNQRLDHTLDLLSKGSRTAAARQATLRGAIAWSHELLSEAERVLFRRLAVFTGGWRLAPAERVCAGDGLDPAVVLSTLEALVDKSLVAVGDESEGQTRYRLLETIGAYAGERLQEAGEVDVVQDRHAAWCVALVTEASASPEGSDAQAALLGRLDTDHANLLAGLEHLLRRDDVTASDLAIKLGVFWEGRGHWQIARTLLSAALAANSSRSAVRARLLSGLADVATDLGEYPEALALLQEAISIAREVGDRTDEMGFVGRLGLIASAQGDFLEMRARNQEALGLARGLGNRRSESIYLGNLGSSSHELGELAESRAYFEAALDIARELGNRRIEGLVVGNLGNVASDLGNYAEAAACYRQAINIARDLGNRRSEEIQIGNLGDVASRAGDHGEARRCLLEALEIARELGDRRLEGFWVGYLGRLALREADHAEAGERLAVALGIARDLGDRRGIASWVGSLGQLATRAADHPAASAHLVEAVTVAGEVAAVGLSVETITFVAELFSATGSHEAGVELMAWVQQTRSTTGLVADTADRATAVRLLAAARCALAPEQIERAQREGSARAALGILALAADRLAALASS